MDRLSRLVHQLRTAPAAEREAVYAALKRLDAVADLTPLFEALQDSSPWVRMTVADVLGDLGDRRAVDALCQALADADLAVQEHVVEALSRLEAAVPLSRYLRDPEGPIVTRAMDALRRMGAPAVGPLCVSMVSRSPLASQRATALLIEIGEAAVEPLSRLLAEDDAARSGAAQTLLRIGTAEAEQALERGDWRVVVCLCQLLTHTDTSLRAAARRILLQIGVVPTMRALVTLQAAAVPALRDFLSHLDPGIRKEAAGALGALRRPEGAAPLCRALDDADAEVRQAVRESLLSLGSAAIPELRLLLENPPSPLHRRGAAEVAAEMALREPVPALRNLLPGLKRQLRPWVRLDAETREALRLAVERVQIIASLPVTAAPPRGLRRGLPLPAAPRPTDPGSLPIPGQEEGGPTPPGPT